MICKRLLNISDTIYAIRERRPSNGYLVSVELITEKSIESMTNIYSNVNSLSLELKPFGYDCKLDIVKSKGYKATINISVYDIHSDYDIDRKTMVKDLLYY